MLFALLFAMQTQALPLKPVPPGHLPVLTGSPTVPTCDQIQARLKTLGDNWTEHATAMGSYLTDIENSTTSWYTQLQPYEGQAVTLPKGTFDPINSATKEIDDLNTMASANFSYLGDDLQAITQAVATCMKSGR